MLRTFCLLLLFMLAPQCRADDYGSYQQLNVCENMAVEVTSIQVLCDAPRTFYYGSGVHRNSPVCDYGDKATISVEFNVAYALNENAEVYMMLDAYINGLQLYSSGAKELCSNYVGDTCTNKGSYNFTTQVQFQYLDGSDSNFVPLIEMAFSSQADGGSNLGGANIGNCYSYSDNDNGGGGGDSVVEYWNEGTTEKEGVYGFATNYGIFLGTLLVLSIFVYVLFLQNGDKIECGGPMGEDPRAFELMERP